MSDLDKLLPWLSIIGTAIAIYAFLNQRRNNAVEQGKKQQEIEQLKKDLREAFEKLRILEKASSCTDVSIEGLKKDVKYIVMMIEKIEAMLGGKHDKSVP